MRHTSDASRQPERRGFIGAAGAVGAIGDFRLPARRFEIQRLDAPSCTAAIVRLERDFPVSGHWYSEDVHYFDMSFIARPPASRGCFADVFPVPQTYGKVFLAPAGYRLRGEGPPGCAQHSLNVFLRARPLIPDEATLGDGLVPLLRDCLRLRSGAVHRILERIAAEVAEPGFAAEILVEGLGLTLLAETARDLRQRTETLGRKGGLPRWRIRLIEARVREGGRPPTLSELADLCSLSPRQLTRAFREETGRTVGAFVQALTIERARALLADTDLPIRAVASSVGFASAAAFSAAFRRAVGRTPREYRARGI